ncbi:MAG: hypothetical protein H6612_06195 [Ignavibacteriales bacterium]|nr:hypothetical protein [Ignavibacteriales bacterium]
MKKIIMSMFFLSSLIFAQYWGERTTEQSFEQSNLYFQNHYLNTFGVKYYKDIAVGMIDDPFLNIELNPALIPDIGDKEIYIYLDFRGDRTEPTIVQSYVQPLAMESYSSIYIPPIDRRWFSDTRTEPEPLVSLGIITYPLESNSKDFYLGGTYQLILKEESYYSMPYWIYNSQYYYDSFGNELASRSSYDIVTRYSGSDEMVNEGHIFSVFTGYKFSDNLNFGLALNGISHSRKGNYANQYYDTYYLYENYWNNSDYTQRKQEYDDLDINAGVIYKFTPLFTAGLKLGLLSGAADQHYETSYSYGSEYGSPEETLEWYKSYSSSSTVQKWNQDGNTYYFRLYFNRKLNGGNEASGFYKYGYTDIETSTSSAINDTSFHSSHGVDYDYNSVSSLSDIRKGLGTRNKYAHEAMLNFKWNLSEKSNLIAGVYFNSNKSKIFTSEPVIAKRFSNYNDGNYQSSYENKRLEWTHEAVDWSLQIPILFNFSLSEYFDLMLGINRIFESWDITDITTAYIAERRETNNGVEKVKKNFGERYFQPDRGITEDHTDLITRLEAYPSPYLKIGLLLDPDFEDDFRIAQWWLSFKAML